MIWSLMENNYILAITLKYTDVRESWNNIYPQTQKIYDPATFHDDVSLWFQYHADFQTWRKKEVTKPWECVETTHFQRS